MKFTQVAETLRHWLQERGIDSRVNVIIEVGTVCDQSRTLDAIGAEFKATTPNMIGSFVKFPDRSWRMLGARFTVVSAETQPPRRQRVPAGVVVAQEPSQ